MERIQVGSRVRVLDTGRTGLVVVEDDLGNLVVALDAGWTDAGPRENFTLV